MDRKIALVSGSTGFIGSNLCQRLASEGWHVRALVRPTSSLAFLEGVGAERCVGAIDDRASLAAATVRLRTIARRTR